MRLPGLLSLYGPMHPVAPDGGARGGSSSFTTDDLLCAFEADPRSDAPKVPVAEGAEMTAHPLSPAVAPAFHETTAAILDDARRLVRRHGAMPPLRRLSSPDLPCIGGGYAPQDSPVPLWSTQPNPRALPRWFLSRGCDPSWGNDSFDFVNRDGRFVRLHFWRDNPLLAEPSCHMSVGRMFGGRDGYAQQSMCVGPTGKVMQHGYHYAMRAAQVRHFARRLGLDHPSIAELALAITNLVFASGQVVNGRAAPRALSYPDGRRVETALQHDGGRWAFPKRFALDPESISFSIAVVRRGRRAADVRIDRGPGGMTPTVSLHLFRSPKGPALMPLAPRLIRALWAPDGS